MMRAFFVLSLLAVAGFGQQLPRIEGKNLADQKVVLPEALDGHAAVLVIGFTHASNKEVKPWAAKLTPLYPTFPIAVLEDVPRLVRGMATHGIKSDTPADQKQRFLLVFSGEKELKAAADFSAPDDAYLIVVDGHGTIRWRFHGALTDRSLEQLQSHMRGM